MSPQPGPIPRNRSGSRNILLGFASGLVFTASLLIGLIVVDNATDQGGGEPRLPGALGDPIELITGIPITDPDAPVEFDQPIEPSQAAYLPIDTSSSSRGGGAGSSAGGGGVPAGGGAGIDGTVPGDTTELTVAPLRPDPFAPVELVPRFEGLFTGDFFFELLDFPPFRFLDLCADDSTLPGCPPGVGGTVLAPFDGPGLGSLGDFRLGATLGAADAFDDECFGAAPTSVEPEHRLFVWASHPADFHVTYYPGDNREARTVLAFGNADPADPELLRFADDAAEGRLATSEWPRDCFILTEIPSPGRGNLYTVEVEATSLTGATASRTYTYEIAAGRRPPVGFTPLDDHDIRVLVPVKHTLSSIQPVQRASVAFVHESIATSCADLEAEGLFQGIRLDRSEQDIVHWGLQPWDERSVPRAYAVPGPYDPAYNADWVIDGIDLNEGSIYLLCIWWFEAPTRFDPMVIVERETRWITTPNRLNPSIVAYSVQNTAGRPIDSFEYAITFHCGRTIYAMEFPFDDMAPGAEERFRSFVLCDYRGGPIQNPTIGSFQTGGVSRDFALTLDPRVPRGTQRFSVDLSFDVPEPGFGVGVLSDGSARGPTLILNAHYDEGSDSGGDSWELGTPVVFEPPADE